MIAAVSLERLWYWYPAWGDRSPPALRDVELELGPGVNLVGGDSAAGKSTLLRVLNGLVPHFHGGRIAGRATVAGMDVAATPTRRLARQVGFVFQDPDVGFVRGVVDQEVAFAAENLGLAPDRIRRQVGEALERLGIGHLAARRLSSLSGGERQRVALAGALAVAPRVVALDEPSSQLDDAGTAALAGVLAKLGAAGHTVVVAEHRLDRIAARHRLTMVAGRLAPPPPFPTWARRPGQGRADALNPAGPPPSPGPPRNRPGAPRRPAGQRRGPEAWSLRGVTAGRGGRPVLTGVDLAGCGGEVVVLSGPNGAGKTTLLSTIAGLLPPLAGEVARRPGRIAYLPQDPGALLHRRSVRAEVEQTLRWLRSDEDALGLLDRLGLAEVADRDPRDLSGGQRQRAALAAVMAGRPSLVLLDEPTRGMDAAARSSLAATLETLAGGGAAVVMATHDAELAAELADRMVLVAGGGAAVARLPEAVR